MRVKRYEIHTEFRWSINNTEVFASSWPAARGVVSDVGEIQRVEDLNVYSIVRVRSLGVEKDSTSVLALDCAYIMSQVDAELFDDLGVCQNVLENIRNVK